MSFVKGESKIIYKAVELVRHITCFQIFQFVTGGITHQTLRGPASRHLRDVSEKVAKESERKHVTCENLVRHEGRFIKLSFLNSALFTSREIMNSWRKRIFHPYHRLLCNIGTLGSNTHACFSPSLASAIKICKCHEHLSGELR